MTSVIFVELVFIGVEEAGIGKTVDVDNGSKQGIFGIGVIVV